MDESKSIKILINKYITEGAKIAKFFSAGFLTKADLLFSSVGVSS